MEDLPPRYQAFPRANWATLRDATPLTLSEADLEDLRGINESVDLEEVAEVYLPLSRLLNLHVEATQQLAEVTGTFLGNSTRPVPYVIGLAGSVAVGKSTTARLLQALLSRWPNHPSVDLVTTDGFLFPNAELAERGIMHRKGFPESYDQGALIRFLAEVKSGRSRADAPVYSHTVYDIIPGDKTTVCQPDVLIIEGLNVLQGRAPAEASRPTTFVSDFFDFSIYVDAEEEHIEQWYVDRFLALRDTVFQDERSFFRRYGELSHDEAIAEARSIWATINGPNLHENIAPTRDRSDLVLVKNATHQVSEVWLRRS
ncbi:MAG: type I pantothenate kinase [Acidimicrobiales bacterium]